ncbi:MAG: hypothetical protein IKT86_02965, partial [Bacteroidaceae bacterium]|nr:hypothetical protein [Bacteroidaceae bacterium]
TSTKDIYKIRSSSDGINYVNVYTEHGVVGNDKAAKAGLASYGVEELDAYPLTLSSDGTAALCLPFNIVIPEGICAYDATVADINTEAATCTFTPIATSGETLKGGTPTILKGDEGQYSLPITMSESGVQSSLEQSILKGNYVSCTLLQDDNTRKYSLSRQGGVPTFNAINNSTTIAANQCWMECNIPEVSTLALCFSTSTDILIPSATSQGSDKQTYNIAGQRLSRPQKGINIIEGKKVVIE